MTTLADLTPITWKIGSICFLRRYDGGQVTISWSNRYLHPDGKWRYHTDGINAYCFPNAEAALAVWDALPEAQRHRPTESPHLPRKA